MKQPRRPAPPDSVRRVTRNLRYICLTLLLTGVAGLSVYRVLQRVQWLLFDFKPNGSRLETYWLTIHEGTLIVGTVLTVLLAAGALLLIKPTRIGAQLMRFTLRVYAIAALLGTLAVAAAAGWLIWACVHYRLSVITLGWIAIIGIIAVFLLLVMWRFFHNTCRIMKDVHRALRSNGCFQQRRGVRCRIQSQAWLMALASLIPIGVVLAGSAAIAWLITTLLQPILGPVATGEIIRALTGSATSPFAMYAVECARSVMNCLALALTATLYRTYMRAHNEQPPHYWQPHTRGAIEASMEGQRFRHWG